MMDDVLTFGDKPVQEQTIAEFFCIEKASVWHYHKFRIYFAVRNLMYFLRPLQSKFETFHHHSWFVKSDLKPIQKLFPEVNFRFPSGEAKGRVHFKNLFSYLFLLKFRFLSRLFFRARNPEYLLYLTEKYSSVFDIDSLKPKPGHHILEYLTKKIDDRFALLTEVLMPKVRGKSDYSFSWKQLSASYNQRDKIFIEGFMLSGFLSKEVRKSTRNAKKTIRDAYAKVSEADLSLTQKIILELFRSLHSTSGFYLFRYFAARKYFANSTLKAIVAGDENSPLTKSILDAAKSCGIKTIGLQHGTMHDLHPAYLYTPNDRKNWIMPDLTITWGKYWEDFLTERGNYPPGSVVSVGQIRTDIIPVLLRNEKAGNEKQAGVVVFASQPQRDPELRYQAAFDVFKAAMSIPDAKLIVKLHPREFADVDYYTQIASEAGCTNFGIDKTSDLYQLIALSDVVITCFSTVGTETVYFHKPLVILDHLQQDIMGYAAEEVAFQATNAETLTEVLKGILSGNLKINQQKYDSFIQKYAFSIDGKVAERCVEAIVSKGMPTKGFTG
jgi:hypothetical protein